MCEKCPAGVKVSVAGRGIAGGHGASGSRQSRRETTVRWLFGWLEFKGIFSTKSCHEEILVCWRCLFPIGSLICVVENSGW